MNGLHAKNRSIRCSAHRSSILKVPTSIADVVQCSSQHPWSNLVRLDADFSTHGHAVVGDRLSGIVGCIFLANEVHAGKEGILWDPEINVSHKLCEPLKGKECTFCACCAIIRTRLKSYIPNAVSNKVSASTRKMMYLTASSTTSGCNSDDAC